MTQQISELIAIKNYIMSIRNSASSNIDKNKFNELDHILTFIDNKIINLILSDEFKQSVNFIPKETIKKNLDASIIKSSMSFKKAF